MNLSGVSVVIKATGSYLPEKILTNDDLAKMVDTSDEWITTRTGIKERRIANEEETTAFMAAQAAQDALDKANLRPGDIDLLIVATATPDKAFPSIASSVQHILGLNTIPCFDLSAACAGFVYALEAAKNWLISGGYKNALIVGSERMSDIINWSDRSTCVLFGDGAGAAILSKSEIPGTGVIDTELSTNGADGHLLKVVSEMKENGGSPYIDMNGKEVFKFAVKAMEESVLSILKKNNYSLSDIKYIIPHQANHRIIKASSERLGLSQEKFFCNLEKLGNTSAASIPLALNDALTQEKIKPGDIILLVAFGAGLTWGASLIKWHT